MQSTTYKRLIAQIHQFDAATPEQADQAARDRAREINEILRGNGHATCWAPGITTADGDVDELYGILGDASIPDEVEDADGYCRTGYVRLDDTDIPARLLAWRDAAVKAALEAAGVAEPEEVEEDGLTDSQRRLREKAAAMLADYDDGLGGFGAEFYKAQAAKAQAGV